MGKKRIIWLSNVDLLDDKQMQSGTWMHSMFKALSNSNEKIGRASCRERV